VTAAREWSPYGEEAGGTQAGLGFTGEWYDVAAGLMYLRARWYDGRMGRFTQLDLLRMEQNLYLYAGANPLNWADPSGLYRAMVVQGANPVGLAVRSSPYYMPDRGPMFKTNLLRRIPDGTKVIVHPWYPTQSTDPGSPVKWWYKIFSIDGELVGDFFGPWAASEYLVDPTEQPGPPEPPLTPPLPTPPETCPPKLPVPNENGLSLPLPNPRYDNGYGNYSWGPHRGYDITSSSDDGSNEERSYPNRMVYSMSSGQVVEMDTPSGPWFLIRVETDAGYYITYVHIKTTTLYIGAPVEAGTTIIGEYAQVGTATYPHVHVQFELPKLSAIDPAPYWPGGAPTQWRFGNPTPFP